MVISAMSLVAMGLLGTSSVSAVTFSSDVPVSFTFNSVISVQLSSADIYIINDLAPGDASDSNIITVGADTNAAFGFQLSTTVGIKNGTSALVNTNDSTYTFTNLSTNKATLANFSDNTWGYSYCANTAANCNGGSGTWVSGSVGSTTAGYNGLPLDNNTNADERGNGGVTLISTTGTEGEQKTVQFKIGAKASNAQASGAYTNTINFYAVANPEPDFLYDKIAEMSKGKLTSSLLREAIETPTTSSYTTDTSNSGVYEYDSAVFGESSDALTSRKIYIYRGILENDNTIGYGSAGSAVTYPNYVKLSNNTCWRIVRTTGSGGIKMIYSGTWSMHGYDYYTCQTGFEYAGITTMLFNNNLQDSIIYVGYTYNSNYTVGSSANGVATDVVFGSNSNIYSNDTRSSVKTYIEDTWYANNMTSYTNRLETSAGYCNDRSYYGSGSGTTIGDIQSTIDTSVTGRFGARNRLYVNNAVGPTLGCTRGDVDLYRYVTSTSASAGHEYTGNELKYPVALLTADEAALAGSGRQNGNPVTNSKLSYLYSSGPNTGMPFYLLSPFYFIGGNVAEMFVLGSSGIINETNYGGIGAGKIVRPVISLKPGAFITGGTGVATDPWTVE